MELKTYRAKSMHEALRLVRSELGPQAAVLHTREVSGSGLLRWFRTRQIEVTASTSVNVPTRLPERLHTNPSAAAPKAAPPGPKAADPARIGSELQGQLTDLQSMIEDLCQRTSQSPPYELPEILFHIFTDMIEAEVDEDLARELIERVRKTMRPDNLGDPLLVKSRIAELIENEMSVAGPIPTPNGQRSLVALVGPTGVGKTTTIAKLAANYRLREKKRVGLITVDTYRIAAVEQLRTYADIIDLPMEVVSTPREMREAAARLSNLDLVLLDTAGRSPKDEVKIQELKSMLSEAKPDEVYLVLSGVSSAKSLVRTVNKFACVGTSALILTKLDEATGLGNLLPLLRGGKLPLAYLTDGQNVPDDIQVADKRRMAQLTLGMDEE